MPAWANAWLQRGLAPGAEVHATLCKSRRVAGTHGLILSILPVVVTLRATTQEVCIVCQGAVDGCKNDRVCSLLWTVQVLLQVERRPGAKDAGLVTLAPLAALAMPGKSCANAGESPVGGLPPLLVLLGAPPAAPPVQTPSVVLS